jgi:hypothetical protein
MVASFGYLVRKIFHMLLHEMAAVRSIEDWETPRISKSYEMGFSWEEVDVKYAETSYLLSGHLGLFNPLVKMWRQFYSQSAFTILQASHVPDLLSKSKNFFGISFSQNLP